MCSMRLAAIPVDHVTAELTAFPLASEASLGLAVTQLSPILAGSSAALWRAAEGTLISAFPAFSVDELVGIRDHSWFGAISSRYVPLHVYLRRIAHENLVTDGNAAIPKLVQVGARPGFEELHFYEALARWRWRWLALAVPPDLLVAALAETGRPPPQYVEPLAPTLARQLLDHGYAETHLHLGAAFDFSLLWVSALHAIADRTLRHNAFKSPGAPLDEGRMLAPWLIRAVTLRYILAGYLAWRAAHGHGGRLETFLRDNFESCAFRRLGVTNLALLKQGIEELRSGRFARESGNDFAHWQALYRELAGVVPGRFPSTYDQALRSDPISDMLRQCSWSVTPEMRFVAQALEYLEADTNDTLFEALFWQIVRIRALFYRHMIQRPMTPGLQWFIRFYGRLSPARKPIDYALRLQSAMAACGAGQGLRSLEVRTSPEPSISMLVSETKEIEQMLEHLTHKTAVRSVLSAHTIATERQCESWPDRVNEMQRTDRNYERRFAQVPLVRVEPEFGVVYHFSKDRGGGAMQGVPFGNWRASNADPSTDVDTSLCGNPTGYRYARYFNEKEREAIALAWVLRNFPLSLELIRGVDVCTDELGVPFWVLAPLLRTVRQSGDQASKTLLVSLGLDVPSLHMTVHAGEDFVHLLSGLRLVDEAVHLFELREGDRIGHGLSLGVDPQEWAKRAGRVAIAREVRLVDLAWEWFWYRRSGTPIPRRRRSVIEHEIARLSRLIFGRMVDHHELIQLMEDVNHSQRLSEVGFPNGPVPMGVWSVRRHPAPLDIEYSDDRQRQEMGGEEYARRTELLIAYLTDPAVFRNGRVIELVETAGEGEVLAEIQSAIRENLAGRGITVEVNPSSNLLIGDLGDLARHPLWRLQSPAGNSDTPAVSVCLGSDDPVTFGTNIRQEYQLVHDALILAGLSESDARSWLDSARARGLEARFTLPVRSTLKLTYFTAPSLPVSTLMEE